MELIERIPGEGVKPTHELALPFEKRQKSRLRATSTDGALLHVKLPRGTVLRGGDVLQAEDGRTVRVVAAAEQLSRVASKDAHLLTRVAYHLGNRHVPLQVEPGQLSYLHDHVLDDMVRRLGAEVSVVLAPFEPEGGAYGRGHGHGHGEHPHHEHPHPHHEGPHHERDHHHHEQDHPHREQDHHHHDDAHDPHQHHGDRR